MYVNTRGAMRMIRGDVKCEMQKKKQERPFRHHCVKDRQRAGEAASLLQWL